MTSKCECIPVNKPVHPQEILTGCRQVLQVTSRTCITQAVDAPDRTLAAATPNTFQPQRTCTADTAGARLQC